jgi:tRNA U34 5-methylaminomethyl-2-thiouridine-forming methyltransferase MnmC
MHTELLITADGSHTVHIPERQVTFHSMHGAIQESRHVFVEAGFHYAIRQKKSLKIFEMGFGTGLNALLTLMEAGKNEIQVSYHTIDAYPLDTMITSVLNYPQILGNVGLEKIFHQMHHATFGEEIHITEYFSFKKYMDKLETHHTTEQYDIIYFDAFSPSEQPDLWREVIFQKLISMLYPGGFLVTYCSKSIVRKAMMSAGFLVTKITGPWGKREMVRAFKVI